MRNIWTIAKKELKAFFISPIAYIVILVIVATLGIFFTLDVLYAIGNTQYVPSPRMIFQLLVFPLLFLSVPVITMRSLAEENRMGTIELILTNPVRDWELVIGKWLGSFLFFLIAVGITWIYPIIMQFIISPGIDQGTLVSGYLGIILLVAAMCGVGIFISSLFSNQIAALLASMGMIILFWVIGTPAQLSTGVAADIMRYMSFPEHLYSTFLAGIIELKDVVFFLSMTATALFFATMSIEIRRWR